MHSQTMICTLWFPAGLCWEYGISCTLALYACTTWMCYECTAYIHIMDQFAGMHVQAHCTSFAIHSYHLIPSNIVPYHFRLAPKPHLNTTQHAQHSITKYSTTKITHRPEQPHLHPVQVWAWCCWTCHKTRTVTLCSATSTGHCKWLSALFLSNQHTQYKHSPFGLVKNNFVVLLAWALNQASYLHLQWHCLSYTAKHYCVHTRDNQPY